jgi:glycosyltransferase involved in cell wall biosynthesis
LKLPEIEEFINLWPKSLAILKVEVLQYFEQNKIQINNVWFPDIDIIFPKYLESQTNIQIVFFGGFLERVFETGNWPKKNYSFWTLSSNVGKILVEMLKFPKETIKIIPRNALFVKNHSEKKINLNQEIQVVYSGRLSSQKNIEMLLAFSAILQEQLDVDVEVLLLGEWDNQIPKNRGRYIISSYQQSVEEFKEKLNFKIEPRIISNLDHDGWLEEVKSNAILVNFSTFVCEDFGVSIAQAQSLGMPMILSNWGGHSDVIAENCFLVEFQDIGESLSVDEQIILKAQIVVSKFLDNKLRINNKKVNNNFSSDHCSLNLDDLQKIRLGAIEHYGNEMTLLGQDRMSLLASSQAGKIFFKDFSNFFAGAE